ncbi:MAG: PHP domain-containing protein [Clostridiales bacterium]|jgi:predicted metal-dependent phosphoesterase TrpH|nr:PHP domain-containing protein [Clostridiales bacterium]
MRADLHVHSYYSDGEHSPAELVRELKEKGIEVASLADHDSVAGISEFIGASKKEGIVAISGIELSTFSLAEIHILGYNVDINNQKFFQALEGLRQLRRKRLLEILEKLKEFKIDMPEEEVAKKAGKSESAGRVHIARALTERGICGSVAEAFDKLLGYGKPAYVPSHRISPREGIEIIKAGGGKAVLAHPFLTGLEPQGLACLVRELKSCGLNGIEAQYSTHTIGETQFLLKLAKAEGLIATCGSDYHGEARERPIKAFELSEQDFKGLMS